MQAGLGDAYDSIKAFSETNFVDNLTRFDVPTLVMDGDDQVVPFEDSAPPNPSRAPSTATSRAHRTERS